MNKIKVYIVDDHEMFREGVKVLLSKSNDFEIIGVAANGKQCLSEFPNQVDVTLMDISMPEMNGIETTKALIEKNTNLKIIALSMFGDEEYYYKMIHAGVKGFVLKESGSKELEEAILAVHNGSNYFSQELLRNIIFNFNDKKSKETAPEELFTTRELEIITCLCTGMTNKEIADEMNISLRTVESHKSNLLQKAGVKNTIALVMYAIKNGIVKIN